MPEKDLRPTTTQIYAEHPWLQKLLEERGPAVRHLAAASATGRRVPTLDPAAKASAYAWWRLTQTEKEALEAARSTGRFGGQPGRAPYWHVAEEGANVYPTSKYFSGYHYIRNTATEIYHNLDTIIRDYLNS